MARRLDVVIFGATGHTGKYTVQAASTILKGLKWGVAGRDKAKLERVLGEGQNISDTPIILADVSDENSLLEMAKQTRIIVNCCGPYHLFGEPVVKACIEAGTHMVDVSAESQYMELMQLKYNDKAHAKGIFIVSACGFDSIPAEMGTIYLQDKFNGIVNSVEFYWRLYPINPSTNSVLSYGTWQSIVHYVANYNELQQIRAKLFLQPLPKLTPELKARPSVHKSRIAGERWCLPFYGTDKSVVLRSQRHFFENDQQRPVQMRTYIVFETLILTVGAVIGMLFLALMSRWFFGRKLLLKHPRILSLGYSSLTEPSEDNNRKLKWEMTFYGRGWRDSQTDSPMNKKVIARVYGVNPYKITGSIVLLSAVTILKENSRMPESGGVLPPGAAFENTSLITELQKNGFTFKIVEE